MEKKRVKEVLVVVYWNDEVLVWVGGGEMWRAIEVNLSSLHVPSLLYAQSLTQMEREKIIWEFEQLYHSLKEHEYRLLARLEELDLAIYNSINGAITQFSCNISQLSSLIAQLEEKQQQPTRELLQVRLRASCQDGVCWNTSLLSLPSSIHGPLLINSVGVARACQSLSRARRKGHMQ